MMRLRLTTLQFLPVAQHPLGHGLPSDLLHSQSCTVTLRCCCVLALSSQNLEKETHLSKASITLFFLRLNICLLLWLHWKSHSNQTHTSYKTLSKKKKIKLCSREYSGYEARRRYDPYMTCKFRIEMCTNHSTASSLLEQITTLT